MPSQLGKSLGMLRGNVRATQYALRAGLRDGHAAQGRGLRARVCVASAAQQIRIHLGISADRNNQSSFGDFVKQVDCVPRIPATPLGIPLVVWQRVNV